MAYDDCLLQHIDYQRLFHCHMSMIYYMDYGYYIAIYPKMALSRIRTVCIDKITLKMCYFKNYFGINSELAGHL